MLSIRNGSTIAAAIMLALLACSKVGAANPIKLLVPLWNPPTCDEPAVDEAVPLDAVPTYGEVKRAGKPHCWFPWAVPTDSPGYVGYRVGGGGSQCCRGGECDCRPLDGTWGRDYQGCLPRIIQLGWSNPPRMQAGDGKYDPDGPRFPHATPEMLFAPR